ncbi:hypothetical protein [Candidatus Reidiella endopervernicosa]|uniref:Uncharacterized protein n=1 Tax=Candidatus Reidiella endopervernicosa TaxID=2738883 RepID=A0A6N0HWQ2_9GAMM|nr:hypothetical protein [Candidatus Reidiella endopervernicosa]QKQ26808.1 hypothetical protein HUE57_11325 [Candidatus Reidiella endopervernicosa]
MRNHPSRLYTTPSVTLRRHKAAAASSVVRSRSQLRICRRRRLSRTNRLRFAIHGGQRKRSRPSSSTTPSAA